MKDKVIKSSLCLSPKGESFYIKENSPKILIFCNVIGIPRYIYGNFLVVQRLGRCAFTTEMQVQSLIGELRYHNLCSAANR